MSSLIDKEEAFSRLIKKILVCKKCPRLVKSRREVQGKYNHPILPHGNLNSKLMIIGMAPGRSSKKLGDNQIRDKPFAYGSGELLRQMLNFIGLSEDDVFITNIVLCNTPEDGKIYDYEVKNCKVFLNSVINIVQPQVIALLGNFAVYHFLKRQVSPGKIVVLPDGTKVVTLWHPAYIQRNPDAFEQYKQQWLKVKKCLEEVGE